MCLAIPAKIIRIKNSIAFVKYPQNDDRQAKIITGSYKPGDYVIVQAGLVIDKVPKKQVKMWNEFLGHGQNKNFYPSQARGTVEHSTTLN